MMVEWERVLQLSTWAVGVVIVEPPILASGMVTMVVMVTMAMVQVSLAWMIVVVAAVYRLVDLFELLAPLVAARVTEVAVEAAAAAEWMTPRGSPRMRVPASVSWEVWS